MSKFTKGAFDYGDGVGLVTPEEYFLLDIDHRELSDPFVQMMLARFDTYTEYSPSGNSNRKRYSS